MILGFKQLHPLSVSLLLLLCVLCIWMCWWRCVCGSKDPGSCVSRYMHTLGTCFSEFRRPPKVPVLIVYLVLGNMHLFFFLWGILLSLPINSIMECWWQMCYFLPAFMRVLDIHTQALTLSQQVISWPLTVQPLSVFYREGNAPDVSVPWFLSVKSAMSCISGLWVMGRQCRQIINSVLWLLLSATKLDVVVKSWNNSLFSIFIVCTVHVCGGGGLSHIYSCPWGLEDGFQISWS